MGSVVCLSGTAEPVFYSATHNKPEIKSSLLPLSDLLVFLLGSRCTSLESIWTDSSQTSRLSHSHCALQQIVQFHFIVAVGV